MAHNQHDLQIDNWKPLSKETLVKILLKHWKQLDHSAFIFSLISYHPVEIGSE